MAATRQLHRNKLLLIVLLEGGGEAVDDIGVGFERQRLDICRICVSIKHPYVAASRSTDTCDNVGELYIWLADDAPPTESDPRTYLSRGSSLYKGGDGFDIGHFVKSFNAPRTRKKA